MKMTLKKAGEEAIEIMKRAVAAGEQFGGVTLIGAEGAVRKLAEENGLKFEAVEKEAQRISLGK